MLEANSTQSKQTQVGEALELLRVHPCGVNVPISRVEGSKNEPLHRVQ